MEIILSLTKNDRKILVSLIVSPIGEMGQGVIVVFRDVTKEKAEELVNLVIDTPTNRYLTEGDHEEIKVEYYKSFGKDCKSKKSKRAL